MPKSLFFSLFLITACLFGSICKASECTPELDTEIEALLDSNILELEAPVNTQGNCVPTCSIVQALTPATNPSENPPIINAVNILKEDLYKHTTGPVTRRSLLDQPALMCDYFSEPCWSFMGDIFFNYSPKMYFTKDSPFIKSYIDLTNENIINEVSNVEFVTIDLPGVLGLFGNLKLYQYRVGLMASFARKWDNWLITARIPLYYLLEHFYLTDQEVDRIKNNPFFTMEEGSEGFGHEKQVEAFALQHLVSDKFGVGDTRLSLLGHVVKNPRINMWFGPQLTIPTAKDFKRGLLAGEFNPDEPIPPFNLQYLFNLSPLCHSNEDPNLASKVLRQQLTDFLVSALDRLSTILINTPLGNGKHFGLGPEFDCRFCFTPYFSAHTYAALEFYMPHNEKRFFLMDKRSIDFNRDWRNTALCGENLAVLNRLVVSTLFPVAVKTSVYPGPRFQINQAFMYTSKHWDLKLGFDYWFQGKEKLNMIIDDLPVKIPLVECKALRPAADQGKLFFNAGYYDTLCNDVDWRIMLSVDATVFHRGIGENYTGSLRVGVEF